MQYLLTLFILTFLINFSFSQHIIPAESIYPSIFDLKIERTHLMDFWLLLIGSRKSASDYAWIRLLQYYGTHYKNEGEKIEENHEDKNRNIHIYFGKYYDLKNRAYAVIKFDPFFKYTYLYAAGALAFNQNRYDDAIEILNFGIKYLPKYWRLQLILSAISFKEKLDYDNATRILAQGINEPDCPMLIKNILAILYEQKGDYKAAKEIWIMIEKQAVEEGYKERAKKHLEKIKNLYKM